MSDFFKKYVTSSPNIPGIPGMTMNAPIRPTNNLKAIGLELEIEGRGLPNEGHLDGIVSKSGASWITHEDGSLRGEAKEYVLDKPIDIDEVPVMVSELYNKFQQLGTVLHLSNRCSTHVHKNIAGLKINSLTSIVALWTAFEEILINWCGEERVSNHFCLSAKDSDRNITLWDEYLRNGRRNFPEGSKYTAMHLRSIWNIGSIEFRPMCASSDPGEIVEWVKLVNGLCEYAKTSYNNPSTIANEVSERRGTDIFYDICRFSGNSNDFIESVFAIPDNRNFDALVLDGLRRVQNLCLGYPWDEWMKNIDKEYVPTPFGEKKIKTPARELPPILQGDNPARDFDVEPDVGRLNEIANDVPVPRRVRIFNEAPRQAEAPRPDHVWVNI